MKLAFIGMMGSGKTTISKVVSDLLSLKYFSIDEEIEKNNKKTITDIFKEEGEAYFRNEELLTISRLAKENEAVVDCGGGIVLNPENIKILKENGFIVLFLDRDIDAIFEDIDFNTRPLLKENPEKLFEIYNHRIEKYRTYGDYIIDNDGTIDKAVKSIKNLVLSLK